MGIDWSAHPLDIRLIADRLIPFALTGAAIDDLIDRAVDVTAVAVRASAWKLAVLKVDQSVFWAGSNAAIKAKMVVPQPPLTWLEKLAGKKPRLADEREQIVGQLSGLPGFDSDLHAFGRPFFVDADSASGVADGVDRYLNAAGAGDAAVDAVARDMARALDAKRESEMRVGLEPQVAAVVRAAPVLGELRPVSEPLEADAERKRWTGVFARWQEALAARDLNAAIGTGDQRGTVAGVRANIPFEMVAFASHLTPGWMGRGYAHPTGALTQIKAGSGLFESPASLFADLIKVAPEAKQALHATIQDNFTLGGYLPPHKVAAYVDLLEARKQELIFAFEDDPASLNQVEREQYAVDWIKIHEATTYAAKHNLGFIEAAEIYSAPLGWFN